MYLKETTGNFVIDTVIAKPKMCYFRAKIKAKSVICLPYKLTRQCKIYEKCRIGGR